MPRRARNSMNKSEFNWAWPYLALIAAVSFAYLNTYSNMFMFDDASLIVRNQFLLSWSHLPEIFTTSTTAGVGNVSNFYRPLQIMLYLIVYKLFGLSTTAFHELNIILHAANACLVYALATKKLNLKAVAAFIMALLWALHPLHTEAVTYMSATADPLHVMFILCGLMAWRPDNVKRQVLTGFCFILALLAKEAAIVFPALLVITLWFTQPRAQWLKATLATWPCWVIAGIYLVLRAGPLDFWHGAGFYKEANAYTESIAVRAFTFFSTLPDYFSLMVHPTELHMERQTPFVTEFINAKVLTGFGIVLTSLALMAGACLKNAPQALRVTGFAAAWFFAAYFPCMGVFMPVNSIFLEHWMYLPAIGLFLGFGELMGQLVAPRPHLKWPLGFAAVVFAGMFAVITFNQNRIWGDPFIFFTQILKYEHDRAPRALLSLGLAYETVGENDKALEYYQKVVDLGPASLPQVYRMLGHLHAQMNHTDEAIAAYKKALELKPDDYASVMGLADIYARKGQKEEAANYKARGLEMLKNNPYLQR